MRPVWLALCWLLAGAAAAQDQPAHPFDRIAAVFQHPRCINCHVRGDRPGNGEDGQPHRMRITRGTDGYGAPAARCIACHRGANNAVSGVPGTPDWRLAPPSTGWGGLSSAEVCRAIKDPQRNGGLDLPALLKHMQTDPRVAWAWEPGGQRAPIPMPRDDFLRLFRAWTEAEGPCPPS